MLMMSNRVLHSNFTNMVDVHHDYIEVEQDAADIVKASSELAYLMKIGVKQLISEIYSSKNDRRLTWYDAKGGMGNQLGGVSGALILGACSGRKIQLGIRSTSSVSRWLWRDYFEMPLPDWIAKSKDIHKLHRVLKGSKIPKKKPSDILKSRDKSVVSEVHHKAVPDMLTGDADGHKLVLDCLGRAAFRARNSEKSPQASVHENAGVKSLTQKVKSPQASVHENAGVKSLTQKVKSLSHKSVGSRKLQGNATAETASAISREEKEAGARAIEDFPQVLIKVIPTLVDVTSSALGAIEWKPKDVLQKAVDNIFSKWGGPFDATKSVALQVRACLDCGWVMSAAKIAQDAACDIALLEHTSRQQSVASLSQSHPSMKGAVVASQSVYVHEKLEHLDLDKRSQPLSNYSTRKAFLNATSTIFSVNTSDVLEQSSRKLRTRKVTSPTKKSADKSALANESSSKSAPQHSEKTPGLLPPLSSLLLPPRVQPLAEKISLLYVTTESDEAGAAIVSAIQALHPDIKIVSTVENISTVKFTHTSGGGDRIKPVS